MHVYLRDLTGQIQEGIILAGGRDTIRVIFPHQRETTELKLSSGLWTSDRGAQFELESITAPTSDGMRALGDCLKARTMTAGVPLVV
jgi:hypothetical protein